MKLYQLQDGAVLNLDMLCSVEPCQSADDREWRALMANGRSYYLEADDARSLMDAQYLDLEFMAE